MKIILIFAVCFMIDERNKLLAISEILYKSVDQYIENNVLGKNNEIDYIVLQGYMRQFESCRTSLGKSAYDEYLDLVYLESDFLFQQDLGKNSIEGLLGLYKKHYRSYVFDWYKNSNNFDTYISSWSHLVQDAVCIEDSVISKETPEYIIATVLDKISTIIGGGYDKDALSTIAIAKTDTSLAYYERRKKTMYINEQVQGNFKLYVVLHELMHHIHFSICDNTIRISEFDYGAGLREGIVIYLTELVIESFFPSLWEQHYKYLMQIQIRGYLSYCIFNNSIDKNEYIGQLSKTGLSKESCLLQYCSTIKYPGYKESYYIFYDVMKQQGTQELQRIMRKGNEY